MMFRFCVIKRFLSQCRLLLQELISFKDCFGDICCSSWRLKVELRFVNVTFPVNKVVCF